MYVKPWVPSQYSIKWAGLSCTSVYPVLGVKEGKSRSSQLPSWTIYRPYLQSDNGHTEWLQVGVTDDRGGHGRNGIGFQGGRKLKNQFFYQISSEQANTAHLKIARVGLETWFSG